jgi:ribosome-binding protein aMBF1 (putative translation factor)
MPVLSPRDRYVSPSERAPSDKWTRRGETFCLFIFCLKPSIPPRVAKKKLDWTLEKRFGEVVAARRNQLGLNQDELAHRAGLALSTIQKYEAGEREPRARAIIQLAQALEISSDSLFRHTHWVRPSIGSKGRFEHTEPDL